MATSVNYLANLIQEHWGLALSFVAFCADVGASCHAVLYKRETRAAIAWVGFIWLVPVAGTLLYFLLGINRLERRARSLRRRKPARRSETSKDAGERWPVEHAGARVALPPLARLVGGVTGMPLLPGNRLEPLVNGDEAYPAMLQAIAAAQQSVSLGTYIFDNDELGQEFVTALGDARARGVDIRVLIDDVGLRYSWPSILGKLRQTGIRTVAFLP